jgi:hypothetical protein
MVGLLQSRRRLRKRLLERKRTDNSDKCLQTRHMSTTAWNPPAVASTPIVGHISDKPLPQILELDEQARRVARYVRAAEQLDSRTPLRSSFANKAAQVVDESVETAKGSLFIIASAEECLISLCGDFDIANSEDLSKGTFRAHQVPIATQEPNPSGSPPFCRR